MSDLFPQIIAGSSISISEFSDETVPFARATSTYHFGIFLYEFGEETSNIKITACAPI